MDDIAQLVYQEETIDSYVQNLYPNIGNLTWMDVADTYAAVLGVDYQDNIALDLNSTIFVNFTDLFDNLTFTGSNTSFSDEYNQFNFIYDDENPYNWYKNYKMSVIGDRVF